MTEDHLSAIIAAADATKDDQGWSVVKEGRHLTLYVAAQGSSLTVNRVDAIRLDGPLVKARTVRGEMYVLALVDLFAGQVEASQAAQAGRRAGFG